LKSGIGEQANNAEKGPAGGRRRKQNRPFTTKNPTMGTQKDQGIRGGSLYSVGRVTKDH